MNFNIRYLQLIVANIALILHIFLSLCC